MLPPHLTLAPLLGPIVYPELKCREQGFNRVRDGENYKTGQTVSTASESLIQELSELRPKWMFPMTRGSSAVTGSSLLRRVNTERMDHVKLLLIRNQLYLYDFSVRACCIKPQTMGHHWVSLIVACGVLQCVWPLSLSEAICQILHVINLLCCPFTAITLHPSLSAKQQADSANRTGLNFSSEILTFMLGAYKGAVSIDSQWLIKGWITGSEHWLDIFPKRGKILGVCQQSYYSNSMFFFTCLVNGRCHRESILK